MNRHPIGPVAEKWLAGVAVREELAPHTVANYRRFLASFADHIGPETDINDVAPEHIEAWLETMVDQYGAPLMGSTRRTRLNAVRSFFRWAAGRELVARDPARLVRSPRVRKSPPKRAKGDDIARVLAVAEPRARVMMVLALQTGIRRAELAGLQVEDYDRPNRALYIRNGKGGRERWVAVPDEADRELHLWLTMLARPQGPMWPSSHRPGESLTPGTISHIVNRAGQAVGVKLWTHLLRHTALSDAASRGATTWQLQRQAGHADPATTSIYVHLDVGDVRAAMEGRRYQVEQVTVEPSLVADFT